MHPKNVYRLYTESVGIAISFILLPQQRIYSTLRDLNPAQTTGVMILTSGNNSFE